MASSPALKRARWAFPDFCKKETDFHAKPKRRRVTDIMFNNSRSAYSKQPNNYAKCVVPARRQSPVITSVARDGNPLVELSEIDDFAPANLIECRMRNMTAQPQSTEVVKARYIRSLREFQGVTSLLGALAEQQSKLDERRRKLFDELESLSGLYKVLKTRRQTAAAHGRPTSPTTVCPVQLVAPPETAAVDAQVTSSTSTPTASDRRQLVEPEMSESGFVVDNQQLVCADEEPEDLSVRGRWRHQPIGGDVTGRETSPAPPCDDSDPDPRSWLPTHESRQLFHSPIYNNKYDEYVDDEVVADRPLSLSMRPQPAHHFQPPARSAVAVIEMFDDACRPFFD